MNVCKEDHWITKPSNKRIIWCGLQEENCAIKITTKWIIISTKISGKRTIVHDRQERTLF